MGALPAQMQELERLRASASEKLRKIAMEAGKGSPFYRHCEEVWRTRTEAALVSAFNGDFENANVILRRALDMLTFGPDSLRDGLALEDVMRLMDAA
jgi:hypothetical protein